ncbi:phage baseplate assembly protein V [bacterium]|nr:phage baseplate assembly protein V [bacterium]
MLKFGIVTAINPLTAKARVEFADDNILSYWLPILQKKTLKDKFYSIVDVGEQVACLMDENSEDGVILGSIYTSLDEVPGISKDQHIAKFEDGSFIEYNKENQMLTIVAKTVNIVGDIYQTGFLENTDGILSATDITDKKSSMQAMRDIYNSHTHTGNQGSPTSAPDNSM